MRIWVKSIIIFTKAETKHHEVKMKTGTESLNIISSRQTKKYNHQSERGYIEVGTQS